MTTNQYLKKLDNQLSEISDAKFFLLPVSDTHAKMVKRIFTDKLNGDGGRIGEYDSTHPLYVNPNDSPVKFSPIGKTGKQGKTGYFSSYKAFRQAIGRQVEGVDLWLTGRLKSDFTNSLERNGETYVTGVKFEENVGKAEGAIKKYGEVVFKRTVDENKLFRESLLKQILKFLNA